MKDKEITGKKRKFTTWDNYMNPSSDSEEEKRPKKKRKVSVGSGSGKKYADGKMSFMNATKLILEEKGKPLSGNEVAAIMIKRNMVSTGGKTPGNSIASMIYTNMKKKGKKSIFVKLGIGEYALRKWNLHDSSDEDDDDDEEEADKKKKKKKKKSRKVTRKRKKKKQKEKKAKKPKKEEEEDVVISNEKVVNEEKNPNEVNSQVIGQKAKDKKTSKNTLRGGSTLVSLPPQSEESDEPIDVIPAAEKVIKIKKSNESSKSFLRSLVPPPPPPSLSEYLYGLHLNESKRK